MSNQEIDTDVERESIWSVRKDMLGYYESVFFSYVVIFAFMRLLYEFNVSTETTSDLPDIFGFEPHIFWAVVRDAPGIIMFSAVFGMILAKLMGALIASLGWLLRKFEKK